MRTVSAGLHAFIIFLLISPLAHSSGESVGTASFEARLHRQELRIFDREPPRTFDSWKQLAELTYSESVKLLDKLSQTRSKNHSELILRGILVFDSYLKFSPLMGQFSEADFAGAAIALQQIPEANHLRAIAALFERKRDEQAVLWIHMIATLELLTEDLRVALEDHRARLYLRFSRGPELSS